MCAGRAATEAAGVGADPLRGDTAARCSTLLAAVGCVDADEAVRVRAGYDRTGCDGIGREGWQAQEIVVS